MSPLALALAALPLAVPAQTLPNSGQILQQVQPREPASPTEKPRLDVEQPQTAPPPATMPFRVDHIVVEGATAVDAATLHALVADGEGRSLTLAQLQALADRIGAYYHAHGYPLARAVVPAQTLDHGTVRLQVVEARYDSIEVDNRSRVGDTLVRATLAPMRPGQPVTQASLDRALLLLGDLPGVDPHATLRPGSQAGTTQVGVAAEPAPMLDGDVYVDNGGTRYSGRARAGADLDINNPLRHGDLLSFSALTAGSGLDYGRAAYQYTLNGTGTRVGAGYSALRYELSGGPVSVLDAHGTARVASAWLAQPLVRSRRATLDARLQFDRKRLRDDLGAAALHDHRHTRSWTLDLHGQRQDGWLGGGITRAGIGFTHGRLDFDDAAAAAADAATARTQGSYSRWNAHVSRLQQLGHQMRLYAGVQGQGSSDNLDSSEQFILGGPDSVRGYAVGSIAGANGWLATLELQHDLAWGCAGRCQARIFVDSGALRVNADPWAPGTNHQRLSGAGLGLDWIGTRQWLAQIQVATPIGARPDGIRHGSQLWVRLSKGF
jgi:hemolysin activation/secretion protein